MAHSFIQRATNYDTYLRIWNKNFVEESNPYIFVILLIPLEVSIESISMIEVEVTEGNWPWAV